ncbi:hypothetical protein ACLOJK_016397 [Asimina triloba]
MMGRQRQPILTNLIGALKDKASQSKAAILSAPDTSAIHLAVLRATTHGPSLPRDKHVSTLLSFGHGSRLLAASCVDALMLRLHRTHDASVTLKCLIAIHNIIRRGAFILQDQLSVYPATGGRNYLNLSKFRDDSSPEAWQLSSWVRWYARVLEQILFASRILGYFFSAASPVSPSDHGCKEMAEEKVSVLSNGDLLSEFDALVGIVEEICKAPEYGYVQENRVVAEALRLVVDDNMMAQREILVRVVELRERFNCLSFGDSVELACVLKRLESCKQRLLFLSSIEKTMGGDALLCLVWDIKERIEAKEENGDGRRAVRRDTKLSESARIGERVPRSSYDSVRLPSGRLKPLLDLDSIA